MDARETWGWAVAAAMMLGLALSGIALAERAARTAGERASAAFGGIGYDAQQRLLTVRFERGGAYAYCGVPYAVYREFVGAESPGAYYNDRIRRQYEVRRLGPLPTVVGAAGVRGLGGLE
jgi:hypothetical protein